MNPAPNHAPNGGPAADTDSLALAAVALPDGKASLVGAQFEQFERERNTWRRRFKTAARELDETRAELDAIKHSRAYKYGRALDLLVKHPVRTVPRILRSLARVAVGKRPAFFPPALPVKAPGRRKGDIDALADLELMTPLLSETLPVTAYAAFGFDLDGLRDLARTASQAATVCGNHVPLIITDLAEFSLLRDTRIALEYIPDRPTWERHRPDLAWDRFHADRLGHLLTVHRPTRTLLLERGTAPTLDRLIALHLDPPK